MYRSYKWRMSIKLALSGVLTGWSKQALTVLPAEELYNLLIVAGYVWDSEEQNWRKRIGTRPMSKRLANQPASRLMLIRIMGNKSTIDEQLENFTLAMEMLGYDVISVDRRAPMPGTQFDRLYLKVRIGK